MPGYRTYDLAKDKAIVKQLGGINFTMLAGQSQTNRTLAEGLQIMWQAAGIKVALSFVDTPTVVNEFTAGTWQADLSADGAFDPAAGVAQMFRFLSTSPFSGVDDPKLDALLNRATTVPETQRGAVYHQVAQYGSDNAYGGCP